MPFQPGNNANPTGTKTRKQNQIKAKLVKHVDEAVETLLKCMRQGDGTAMARLPAVKEILTRVFGSAPTSVQLTGEDGGALSITVNVINKTPPAK